MTIKDQVAKAALMSMWPNEEQCSQCYRKPLEDTLAEFVRDATTTTSTAASNISSSNASQPQDYEFFIRDLVDRTFHHEIVRAYLQSVYWATMYP